MTQIKTVLAPTAAWPTATPKPKAIPKSPGRPRKPREKKFPEELDAMQLVREHLAARVIPKPTKKLMMVYFDAAGKVINAVEPRPTSQPMRSGMHNYTGRPANIWTEGYRAAEKHHKIGTSKKRTK